MYNNITQSITIKDFQELKKVIESIDVESFFRDYPQEERLHIRSENKNLFFSFTKEEIYELRKLMNDAQFKIDLLETVKRNLN